jgi:16S rRNA (guanine966-N2)-methyltransferase
MSLVRVIAGELGGRKLASVPGMQVRPTSDRVREAMFNSLESRGLVAGADVLDLYAGTGALGIEALSRGAARATFVDADRRSAEVVRANLARLGAEDRATVVISDAAAFVQRTAVTFDLALLDPPYRDDSWYPVLEALPAAAAVVESATSPDPPAGWAVLHHRRYGRTHVTLFERVAGSGRDD